MKQPKEILKTYFETGDKPTEQQFCDLIDSYHHLDNGAVVTSIRTGENGDHKISFSDGNGIVIKNSDPDQNNKVRVVDLGVLRFGGNNSGARTREIKEETAIESISIEKLPPQQKSSIVQSLLVNAINNLNPPLVIGDDENIIFEFDIEEGDVFLASGR